MAKYTEKDKICPHCGGELKLHCAGEIIIIWCDSCGSNNPDYPPNISIETNN
jgi:formamidopyrimidine-DNA glycosylase